MTISSLFKVRPLAVAVSMASVAAFANVAYAQDQEEVINSETIVENAEAEEAMQQTEEVVVTGSRLRRDSYSSVSPIQVLDAQTQRDLGSFDAASLLQNSTAASGQQIDLTFSGFVLDNGPGASTISLRGLGASRSLVLMNGRRVAPAGVEGSVSTPDLNLLPSGMIARYEILLDGASSVYGSDAVAGVVNAITRKDFDGFELTVNTSQPSQPGGEENSLNLMWGQSSDRGFISAGIEYTKNEPVRYDDRTWTATCDKNYEVGLDGNFYSEDLRNGIVRGMETNDCKQGGLAGYVAPLFNNADFLFYTPGSTNSGLADWSYFRNARTGGIIDGDGDGVNDVSFKDYSLNGKDGFSYMYPEQERIAFLVNGEYTLDGESNLTPFFEVSYASREQVFLSGSAQVFPDVPASNPFNICNPDGIRGVDCGDIYAQTFFGFPPGAYTPGAIDVQPVVGVRGDRSRTEVTVAQTRFVGGLRGDLPGLDFGSLSNWSFEIMASSSYSDGQSSRFGVRGDRLALSLETTIEDPNNPGSFICGVDNDGDGVPDGTDGCVPVDLFADSLNGSVIGDFATTAERDYLLDTRDFDTKYYQHIFSAYMTGDVYELPAGVMSAVVGAEYRYDEIDSQPDDVARDGLFFGYFRDAGATGTRATTEVFGEVSIPILANKPLVTELTLDLSTRYTKDEFYDGHWTGGAKLGYRPVDSLLLRATYGTSYRAPDMRELFLEGQTGFNTVSDPCGIPNDALVADPNDPLGNRIYDSSLDERDPNTLANCLAAGIDPTTTDFNGTNAYQVEVLTQAGSNEKVEETSTSLSAGFSFDQPFWNDFDLNLSFNYYEIEVNDALVEASAQFVINDCYFKADVGASALCGFIQRSDDGRIDEVGQIFLNRDAEVARGLDFNIVYNQDVTVFDLPFTLSASLVANKLLESSLEYSDDDGQVDFEDYVGEFGYAEWTGNTDVFIRYEDWQLGWGTRFIGAVAQDPRFVDPYSDVFDTNGTGFTSDSCLGVVNGATDCRDVGFADDYLIHSFSLQYAPGTWGVTLGVTNAFNEAPPRVDSNEITAKNNTPLGAGYDLQGRTMFLSASVAF
jgi:iron complex outermembrane receptor protein